MQEKEMNNMRVEKAGLLDKSLRLCAVLAVFTVASGVQVLDVCLDPRHEDSRCAGA